MQRKYCSLIFSTISILVLILDTKTAVESATTGIMLCLQTVIPSLFPFICLSSSLTNSLSGIKFTFLQPLSRLCGIPHGTEGYFIVGILGGYPTGAACIAKGYAAGQLNRHDAENLLSFCSNAGPAFLFGMAAPLFSSPYIPWILWSVHIFSAILTGALLCKNRSVQPSYQHIVSNTPPASLQHALLVMASICGWVVLFRVILGFCEKWFLWLFPIELKCFFIGLLELSNGCYNLSTVPLEAYRFLILSSILAFGGICVTMQTYSVTKGLSLRMYLVGKATQTLLSIILSFLIIEILYKDFVSQIFFIPVVLSTLLLLLIFFLIIFKKTVAIPAFLQYNVRKT